MKLKKQLAALFLAFAMIIGLFATPTVTYAATQAAELEECGIKTAKISYQNEEITVNSTADVIYYSTSWREATHARTVWDEAYNVKASNDFIIDFSTLPATRTNSIWVTDDITKKPYEVVIKAQETTLAVAFSGIAETQTSDRIGIAADWTDITALTEDQNDDYGFLCVTVGKKNNTKTPLTALSATEVGKYLQWKKGTTGKWQFIDTLNLQKYAAKGVALYFRIAPIDDPEKAVTSSSALKLAGRASKEVKVSYVKKANAPRVTINGATKLITLQKTWEYRVSTNAGSSYGDWISVSKYHMDGNKVKQTYLSDLLVASGQTWEYAESNEGQVLQVRVAATSRTLASKIATVTLNKATAPEVSTSAGIAFELVKDTTLNNGIRVTNSTNKAMQVAVVSGEDADVNDTKAVRWTTIPAKTTTANKSVIISKLNIDKGDRILYRYAAINDVASTPANEFTVSSPYGTLLEKDYPKPLQQTLTLTKGDVTAASTASASAEVGKASGAAVTVTVNNTASPSAITVVLNVDTTNVDDRSTFRITPQKAGDGVNSKITMSQVSAVKSNKGSVKISIAKDAESGSRDFTLLVDGYTYKVTVVFKLTEE